MQLQDRPVMGTHYTLTMEEFIIHVQGLLKLFWSEEPPMVFIQPMDKHKICYFIADASAEGLGSAIQYGHDLVQGIDGLWEPEFSAKGSNMREAQSQG